MTMIGCAEVVSVNTSYSRYYNLIWFSFSPHHILMYYTSWTLHGYCDQQYIQHRYTPVFLRFTIYTIPLLFLKTLPQLQPELQLKVVTFGKALTSSPCKRGAIRQTYEQNETVLSVGKRNMCSVNYEKPKRVQEEQTRQRHCQNNQDPCRSTKQPQQMSTNQWTQRCQQHQQECPGRIAEEYSTGPRVV